MLCILLNAQASLQELNITYSTLLALQWNSAVVYAWAQGINSYRNPHFSR